MFLLNILFKVINCIDVTQIDPKPFPSTDMSPFKRFLTSISDELNVPKVSGNEIQFYPVISSLRALISDPTNGSIKEQFRIDIFTDENLNILRELQKIFIKLSLKTSDFNGPTLLNFNILIDELLESVQKDSNLHFDNTIRLTKLLKFLEFYSTKGKTIEEIQLHDRSTLINLKQY